MVKFLPDNDVVQTEGRVARGRERRGLREVAVFRAFDVGRCDVGNPRVFGRKIWGATSKGSCLQMGRGRSCSNEVDCEGFEARHGRRERKGLELIERDRPRPGRRDVTWSPAQTGSTFNVQACQPILTIYEILGLSGPHRSKPYVFKIRCSSIYSI